MRRDTVGFATEEMRNPERVLPRGILLGLTITTVWYLLVNVAYVTVLTKDEIVSVDAVAVVSYIHTIQINVFLTHY